MGVLARARGPTSGRTSRRDLAPPRGWLAVDFADHRRSTGSSTAPGMHEKLRRRRDRPGRDAGPGVHAAARSACTRVPFAGKPAFDVTFAMCGLTQIFNMLGWPAISVPCGRDDAGHARSGIQLAALPWRESYCLAAAAVVEAAAALTRAAAVDAELARGRARRPPWRASSTGRRSARPGRGGSTSRSRRRGGLSIAARTASALTVPGGIAAIRRVARSSRRIVPGRLADGRVAVAAGVLEEVVRVDEHAAVVGRARSPGPAGDTSTVQAAPPSLVGDDRDRARRRDVGGARRARAPTTAPSASSSTRRQSTWIGTPTGGPSSRWPRMLSRTRDAAVVHRRSCRRCRPRSASRRGGRRGARSSTRSSPRPARCASPRSGSPSAEPEAVIAPRQAMVEHSPADAARSSVRAFSAPISSTGKPSRAAMPSISAPSSAGDLGGDAVERLDAEPAQIVAGAEAVAARRAARRRP